jgi:hypothetical protein
MATFRPAAVSHQGPQSIEAIMRVFLVVLGLLMPAGIAAQSADERRAVERAVLDYVEGFYEGDTVKLVRSVHPEVFKYGYYVPRDSARYVGEAMPFAEFLSYANRVKSRGQPAPADAPKRVEIYDVQDQTASAKLTAWWGTDYLLLARIDGRWMIRQVLWQSPPRR